MAIEGISVLGYQVEFPTLNLKLKEDDEKMFDYGILHCYIKESNKGFKVKKINKTSKKGTKITYIAIKDENDYAEYRKLINKLAGDFNAKYGSSVTVN